MAKQFFKDLPDTSTPLTASRLNGLLDGEEAMGNLVVESIRSKNMFDSSSLINGVITANGITTSTTRLCNQSFIKVKPNTTYTVSFDTDNNINNINISYFTSNYFPRSSESGWLTNFTFTTGNNINYILLSFRNSNDITITTTNISNIQLEEGSATTYSPYQKLDNNEYILWSGDTTSASITMNDDITNYKYIDVFFKGDGIWNCTRVYASSGVAFSISSVAGSSSSIWKKYAIYQVSTNKLNLLHSWKQDISVANNTISCTYKNNESYITVTRVVGYK